MGTSVSIAFSIFLLILITLSIFIGVFVYRDSKKRGMNSVLWTLLAIIAPCFLGLIIYLIVRTQYYDTKCPKCSKQINENFMVCPHCGEILKGRCVKCNYPLEPEWINCPNCGENVPEEQRKSAPKQSTDKALKWILALVVSIPLIFSIVLISSIFAYGVNPIISSAVSVQLTKEELKTYDKDGKIADILEECDEQGEGIYIIRSDYIAEPYIDDGSSDCYVDALVYRNDGAYSVGAEIFKSSPFSSPSINYTFSNIEDNSENLDYTRCYYQLAAEKEYDINTCNVIGEINYNPEYEFVDFTLISTNEVPSDKFFGGTTLNVEVYFNKSVEDIYSLEYDIFIDDKLLYTDVISNDNGKHVLDSGLDFMYNYTVDGKYQFRYRLLDKNGNVVKETDMYSFEEDDSYFEFEVYYNKDGKLCIDNVTYEDN